MYTIAIADGQTNEEIDTIHVSDPHGHQFASEVRWYRGQSHDNGGSEYRITMTDRKGRRIRNQLIACECSSCQPSAQE